MRKVSVSIGDEELRQYYDKEELVRRFDGNEAEIIRFLYWEEELSQREVSIILGCSESTVRNKMKRYNIKPRSMSEAQILRYGIHISEAELRRLYKCERLPLAKCAEILGCGHETVRKRLRDYGLKSRSRSEAALLRYNVHISEAELRRLYEYEKLSITKCAQKLGCSKGIVRRRMHAYCIKPRSMSEAQVLRYGTHIPEVELRRLYEDERLSIARCAAIFGCSEAVVQRRMRRYEIKARSNAEAVVIAKGYAYERRDFDGDERKRAYYIGFCKGDCSADMASGEGSQTIIVKCGSTIPEQIELFEKLFKPYGHIWKGKPDERGAANIQVYVNMSFAWLLDLTDEIPAFILADDESFLAFLGGYSDAEGHIGIGNGVAVFALKSYDKRILHQIYEKLLDLGIEFPKPRIEKPKGYVTSTGIRYNQNLWCLVTTRKESLLRLFERLNPHLRHPKKIKGLEVAVKNIEERNARLERRRERKRRFEKLLKMKEELVHLFPNEGELIRYLYKDALMSQRKVARILSCDQGTVRDRMKRYGIKPRTLSEAQKIAWGYTPERI
jgi:predicted DNA-binding protein (UPF0251 family)